MSLTLAPTAAPSPARRSCFSSVPAPLTPDRRICFSAPPADTTPLRDTILDTHVPSNLPPGLPPGIPPVPQPPTNGGGQPPVDPPDTRPWTPLQHAAKDLGTTPDGRLHVDGVRWGIEKGADGKLTDTGVFRDAYINPDKVKDVYLVIKPFSDQPNPFPGHALLDFEFEPDAPVTDSQGNKDSGLAVSVEVHLREGEHYDPQESQNHPKPIMYQLGTWSDGIEKATAHDHELIQRYHLALSHDQEVSLLKERVAKSTQDHTLDLYNLIGNSCISTLIDGVNKVIPDKQQIAHLLPDGHPDPTASVPIYVPTLFLTHGLLADPAPQTTFAS